MKSVRPTVRMPDAALNEADIVEQPRIIVTQRRLEANPKASTAWMRRLSGHALLGRRKYVATSLLKNCGRLMP